MAFSKKEIINTLLTSKEGVEGIVLAFNIISAVKYDVLSENKISEFLNDWWSSYLSGDETDLTYVRLQNTFDAVIWEGEVTSKNYLASSIIKRTSLNTEHNYFYSLKEYDQLYKYVLSEGVMDNGEVLPSPDSIDFDRKIDIMFKNNSFDSTFQVSERQHFSKEHSVYWVCPENDLLSILLMPNSSETASAFLGLSHFKNGSYIMAVKLGPEYMEENSGANAALRPTPLDAGYHSRFKCLSDSGKHDSECGFTVDLTKLEQKETNIDGGREFIVNENNATPVNSLLLQPLGRLKNFSVGDNDEFIRRLEIMGEIDKKDLATALENLSK